MTDNVFAGIDTEPPIAGSEIDTLLGSLERIRHTFSWKCADLDAAAMATRIASSQLCLGGLMRHLTRCEGDLFGYRLHDSVGHGEESEWDADFAFTADDDVERTWADWRAAVSRSREQIADALADGGLERTSGHAFAGWGTPSLRRLLADAVEEYARHLGHADLIREAIDGRVGEDAPK